MAAAAAAALEEGRKAAMRRAMCGYCSNPAWFPRPSASASGLGPSLNDRKRVSVTRHARKGIKS